MYPRPHEYEISPARPVRWTTYADNAPAKSSAIELQEFDVCNATAYQHGAGISEDIQPWKHQRRQSAPAMPARRGMKCGGCHLTRAVFNQAAIPVLRAKHRHPPQCTLIIATAVTVGISFFGGQLRLFQRKRHAQRMIQLMEVVILGFPISTSRDGNPGRFGWQCCPDLDSFAPNSPLAKLTE